MKIIKLNKMYSHLILMSFISTVNASPIIHDENSPHYSQRHNTVARSLPMGADTSGQDDPLVREKALVTKKTEDVASQSDHVEPKEGSRSKVRRADTSIHKGKERIYDVDDPLEIEEDVEAEIDHNRMLLPPEVIMVVLDQLDSLSLERSRIGTLSRTMANLVAMQRRKRTAFLRDDQGSLHHLRVRRLKDEDLYKYQVLRTKNFTCDDPEAIRSLTDKYPILTLQSNFDRFLNTYILKGTLRQLCESDRINVLEFLSAVGISEAEHDLVSHYAYEIDGVPVNIRKAFKLNQRLVKKGDMKAVDRRLEWLRNSSDQKSPFHVMHGLNNFDTKDRLSENAHKNFSRVSTLVIRAFREPGLLDQAFAAVDAYVSAGNFDLFESHSTMFLMHGREAAKRLNDIYLKYRYERAFRNYFISSVNERAWEVSPERIYEGKYMPEVPKELGAHEDLLEVLVEEGNPFAIQAAFEGFVKGMNGLPQSEEAARTLIDLCVEKGFSRAITLKFHALSGNGDAYEVDESKAMELNEWAISIGNTSAIKRKFESLWCSSSYDEGEIIYEEDIGGALDFAVERVLSPDASVKDLRNLLVLSSDEDFVQEMGMTPITETLNILHQRKNVSAIYIKVLGLKFGLYGFDKDPEAANQLAMTYLIG